MSNYSETLEDLRDRAARDQKRRDVRSIGRKNRTGHSASAIRLPNAINIAELHDWYSECVAHHGDICNDDYIVDLAQHIDQLVLVDMTKLRSENSEALKQPGALRADDVIIPRTIRDAMYLVQAMDQQYLWVDCLCVMQDASPVNMNRMLGAMAHIYASAEFTIVAAEGADAEHGLPRIMPLAQSISANQQPCEIRYKASEFGYPWASPWVSRGWTFQESLFSRRLLIFDLAVSWICGRCASLEGQEEAPRPEEWPIERVHLGLPVGLKSLLPKIPSLGRWGMLAEEFSSRHLTYEQDAEAAFAGATAIMAGSFPGGLVHGLPLLFFDIALLWRPQRAMTQRANEPSWSWNGWKGSIECLQHWFPYYPGVYRNLGESADWLAAATLRPLAIWHMSPNVEHINRFYEYQALRGNPDAALPDGWSRVEHPEGAYYTHSSNTQDSLPYSYPLPLASPGPQYVPSTSPSVLTCKAPITTACLDSLKGHGFSSYPRQHMFLSHQGGTMGIVSADAKYDIDAATRNQDNSCQLVAISQAEVPRDFGSDWGIRTQGQYPNSPWSVGVLFGDGAAVRLSIYNVLWVGWENGIAYRQGIGIAMKDAWDALEPEVRMFQFG